MHFQEEPYHMNDPKVVAITGKSGYIHRIYSLDNGAIVSAVFSPANGIGILTDSQGNSIPFWEIYCFEGDLLEDVERFPTESKMNTRLKQLEGRDIK